MTPPKEITYSDKLVIANNLNVELDQLVGPDNNRKAVEILLLAAIARCGDVDFVRRLL